MKIIFLVKRKPGMSRDAFREHYETSHTELAKKYFGHLLANYSRNYPVAETASDAGFEYDAITEMTLKEGCTLEDIFKIVQHPDHRDLFDADEKLFLDQSSIVAIPCTNFNTGTSV